MVKDVIDEDYPWTIQKNLDTAMDKMVLETMQTVFRKCFLSGSEEFY